MTPKQAAQRDREIERMRDIIRRKHYSLDTESTYCHWLRRYIAFLCVQDHRKQTPEQKFEAFLTHLARHGCAAEKRACLPSK